MRLGRIGFDRVTGYLQDGMNALRDRPTLVVQSQRITARAMEELAGEITITDIRTPKEWGSEHINGSMNIPLANLADRMEDIPQNGHVIVHSQGGYRSSIASIRKRRPRQCPRSGRRLPGVEGDG